MRGVEMLEKGVGVQVEAVGGYRHDECGAEPAEEQTVLDHAMQGFFDGLLGG
jgi:hypothetical protein